MSDKVNLGGGLLDLITNQISADLFEEFDGNSTNYSSPFSWDIIGKNLSFLAAEMGIFFIANMIIEYASDSDRFNEKHGHEMLKLENVSKTYSGCTNEYNAVKDMNMSVGKGECYGLIGLNGAGKSTTFKMITGQIRCTTGKITFNCDRIGYCSQNNSLDENVSVENHLWIYARIAGYSNEDARKVISQILKEYSMEKYRCVPCGHLSGGNKRKVCAATSMLGRPELILMDEPTSGMDPSTRRLVWKNIGTVLKKGKHRFFTKDVVTFVL